MLANLAAFASRAEAAAALGHPAIRPVLRFEPGAGLLILPHAEGPPLRSLLRPPGMPPARARALLSFLLAGLVAAHERGLVHGSLLLPAQIVCDSAGRPLLGPFGADEIAGLVATRTGALEELLTITAPELRAGGADHRQRRSQRGGPARGAAHRQPRRRRLAPARARARPHRRRP